MRRLGVMGRVTGNAAHAVDIVLGTVEVGVLLAIAMTRHAALAGLVRSLAGEGEDFALVATALDVGLARTVTSLAALGLGCRALQSRLPVRRNLECLVDVFVTGLAGLGADELRGLACDGRWKGALGCFFAGGKAL